MSVTSDRPMLIVEDSPEDFEATIRTLLGHTKSMPVHVDPLLLLRTAGMVICSSSGKEP